MSSHSGNLADPALFLAIEDLELAARSIVEGTRLGVHRSPFTGMASEFETNREYRPGDDLRHVNWTLWARSDQMFLKQYRTDTNLEVHLVLDASGSMGTAHGPASKFAWASRAIAALAFLCITCRDAAGLTLLRGGVAEHIPPRVATGQFQRILTALGETRPQQQADLGLGLDETIHLCARRGMVLYFGDLFDDAERTMRALATLRARGHEVAVFHVLDPWEVRLPESGRFHFTDLETGEKLRVAAPEVRRRYEEFVTRWREDLASRCTAEDIAYTFCPTDRPLVDALLGFLGERKRA